MTSVLVSGSRRWTDYQLILATLTHLRELLGDFQLIHGGARGADTWADLGAKVLGLPEPIVDRPDYARYGRYGAPKHRNSTMLERLPDYVVAFYLYGSGGTADTITKAVNQFRIPTLVITEDNNQWQPEDPTKPPAQPAPPAS